MTDQTLPALFDRADFPRIESMTYLNAAGMGLIPLPVQRAVLETMERIATMGSNAFFDSSDTILVEPRRAVARLFGAEPGSIGIVSSVSEAISQVAAWRRPRRDENVVMIDIDHPSTSYPWLRQAEDTGAEMRFATVADDPTRLGFDSIAALVDHNTAAISVSHIQWSTGFRFDLAALAELAHAHGALLVVDATHSAGVIPLDAPALGVDVIATGSFKWLLSYSGVGGCYLAPALAEAFRPVMVGSRTAHREANPAGAPISHFTLPSDATRLEFGSSAHILRIGYAAAIDYILGHGIDRVARHSQMLGDRLATGIAALGGVVATPRDPAARGGIIAASFPGHDIGWVVDALNRRGVVAMRRMEVVRFSPHGYNHSGDIDACLDALREILGR